MEQEIKILQEKGSSSGDHRCDAADASISEKLQGIQPSKYTILVVDDEVDLREAIAFDFKRKGFSVLEAESGESALLRVREARIDLIVSDIRMPNGDGLFLLAEVRKLSQSIPLIFVTGYSDVAIEECLSRGALAVIPKPFDRKFLMDAVLSALLVGRK